MSSSDDGSDSGSVGPVGGRGRGRGGGRGGPARGGRGAARGGGRGGAAPGAPRLPTVWVPTGTSKKMIDTLVAQFDGRLVIDQGRGPKNPHADAAAVRDCLEMMVRDSAAARNNYSMRGKGIIVAPDEQQLRNLIPGHYICYGAFGGGMAEDYKRANLVNNAVAAGRMMPIDRYDRAVHGNAVTVCGHRWEDCNCHVKRGFDAYFYVAVDTCHHIAPLDLFKIAHRAGCTGILGVQRFFELGHQDLRYVTNDKGESRIEVDYAGTGTYLAHDYTGLAAGGLFRVGPLMVVVSVVDVVPGASYGVFKMMATATELGRVVRSLGRAVTVVDQYGADDSKVALEKVGATHEIVVTNAGITRRYVVDLAAVKIACAMGVPAGETLVGNSYLAHLRMKLAGATPGIVLPADTLHALAAYAICRASRGAITSAGVLAGLTGITSMSKTLEDHLDKLTPDDEFDAAMDRLSRMDPTARDALTGKQPTGFAALALCGGVFVVGLCVAFGSKRTAMVAGAGAVAGVATFSEQLKDMAQDVATVVWRYRWHAAVVTVVGAACWFGASDAVSGSSLLGMVRAWWQAPIANCNPLDAAKVMHEALVLDHTGTLLPSLFDALVFGPVVEEALKRLVGKVVPVEVAGAAFGLAEAQLPWKMPMVEHRMLMHATSALVGRHHGYWAAVGWHATWNFTTMMLMHRREFAIGDCAFVKYVPRLAFAPPEVLAQIRAMMAAQLQQPTGFAGWWLAPVAAVAFAVWWFWPRDDRHELEPVDEDMAVYSDNDFLLRGAPVAELPVKLAAVCPMRDQGWFSQGLPATRWHGEVKLKMRDPIDCPLRLGSTVYFGVRSAMSARPAMCEHSAAVALIARHLKPYAHVADETFFHEMFATAWTRRFCEKVTEVGREFVVASPEEYRDHLPTADQKREFDEQFARQSGELKHQPFTQFPKDELHTFVLNPVCVAREKEKEARARNICSPPKLLKAWIGRYMWSFEKEFVDRFNCVDGEFSGFFLSKFSGDAELRGRMISASIDSAIASASGMQTSNPATWITHRAEKRWRASGAACDGCGGICDGCRRVMFERREELSVRLMNGYGAPEKWPVDALVGMVVPIVCGDDNLVIFCVAGTLYAVRTDISGCDAATQMLMCAFRCAMWYGAGLVDPFDLRDEVGGTIVAQPNPLIGYFTPAVRADYTDADRTKSTQALQTMVSASLVYKRDRIGTEVSVTDVDNSMQSGCADTSFTTTAGVSNVVMKCVRDVYMEVDLSEPVVDCIERVFRREFARAGYNIEVDIDELQEQYNFAPMLPVCSLLALPVRGRIWLSNRPGRFIVRQGNVTHTIGFRSHIGHIKQMMLDALHNNYHNCVIRWIAQAVLQQVGWATAVRRYDRDDEYRLVYGRSMQDLFGDMTDQEDAVVLRFLDEYYAKRGACHGFLTSHVASLRDYLRGWRLGQWFTHPVLVTMAEIDA